MTPENETPANQPEPGTGTTPAEILPPLAHDTDDEGHAEEREEIDDQAPQPRQEPENPSPAAEAAREARALIPVGNTGLAPINYQQQIDYAKTMVQAGYAIPKHLRGNAGDCLAIIDIASRAALSPYMLANKTYVQNDRLCFESQAYHALAWPFLDGDLDVSYKGTGDERTCTIRGRIKGHPDIKSYTSPPLHKLHPGHVTKSVKNDAGKYEPRKFVKGSPLWDDKPDVQQFYDTSRDWIRMFCPRATLGIYTPEEIQKYSGLDEPQPGQGILDKLDTATTDRSQGHDADKMAGEIGNLDRARHVEILPAKPENKDGTPRRRRFTGKRKKNGTKATEPKAQDQQPAPQIEQPPAEPEQPKEPTTSAQYIVYADKWITKQTDYDNALGRWDGEEEMRNKLMVSVRARIDLRNRIKARFKTEPED